MKVPSRGLEKSIFRVFLLDAFTQNLVTPPLKVGLMTLNNRDSKPFWLSPPLSFWPYVAAPLKFWHPSTTGSRTFWRHCTTGYLLSVLTSSNNRVLTENHSSPKGTFISYGDRCFIPQLVLGYALDQVLGPVTLRFPRWLEPFNWPFIKQRVLHTNPQQPLLRHWYTRLCGPCFPSLPLQPASLHTAILRFCKEATMYLGVR